jgi:hypothetical protein
MGEIGRPYQEMEDSLPHSAEPMKGRQVVLCCSQGPHPNYSIIRPDFANIPEITLDFLALPTP